MKKVLLLLFLLLSVAAFADTKKMTYYTGMRIKWLSRKPVGEIELKDSYKYTVEAILPYRKGFLIKLNDHSYEADSEHTMEIYAKKGSVFYMEDMSNNKLIAYKCEIIDISENTFTFEFEEYKIK